MTAVAPVKFVPVIVIIAPVTPLLGVNEVIVGASPYKNPLAEAIPIALATVTLPEAPLDNTAVILVGEFTLKEIAETPPNFTSVMLVKFNPVIVID